MPSRTERYARCLKISGLLLMLIAGYGCQSASSDNPQHCFEQSGQAFSEVLSCYRKAAATKPLDYTEKVREQQPPGVNIRSFELKSQSWGQGSQVIPEVWIHDVDLYIPDNVKGTRAVLVANDGVNIPLQDGSPGAPNNFSKDTLLNIARQTGLIVVAVSNVPNQYLTYSDDGVPRTEDGSVAHSWKLFMQAPEQQPFMSLHVPMMEALVKAMDLAQMEQPGKVVSFLATGASKRGWAVWLSALADPRVDSIVPFVIDVLNTDKVFDQTFLAYGGNWPLAYIDYYSQGVIAQRKSEPFKKLMQVEDPMTYRNLPGYSDRLKIPKYIVNASGDDFFIPDASRQYLMDLPGDNTLRVIPNSAHDVRVFVEANLIPYIKRRQTGNTAPRILKVKETPLDATSIKLQLTLSEMPIRVTQWTATNTKARDFRYNCGVRYIAAQLPASTDVRTTLRAPKEGWNAEFVETEFADGVVETTMVKILPDTYPDKAPPADAAFCKTLPGTPGQ